MSRQDQYNVTVAVDGLGNLGTFDKLEGGEMDSEETKYRPGAMGPPVTLGGYQEVGNITVSRLLQGPRDLSLVPSLMRRCGKAAVTVTKQFLDVDGNPYGRPLVYTGRLKACTPPDHDSESSDAALFELEISSATVA